MSFVEEALIFLVAAVIAVPIFKRLGLGAILGYLAAGVLIGPYVFGFITEYEKILHIGELGVVLLLFVIGLELEPKRLWTMRKTIFGLGSLQLLITGALLAAVAYLFALPWQAALLVGAALALSSTTFALQLLAEKGQMTSRHGRSAFGILLFQDLAAIPLLAAAPLLGNSGSEMGAVELLKAVALIAVLVVGGRIALRYALKLAAQTKVREIFIATGLLTAFGTAYIVSLGGLSMALGSFIAGVILADSEFRHALEADIEPFKGLLLGLFFMAVGMSVNLGLIAAQPLVIVGLTLALLAIKATVLFIIGLRAKLPMHSARKLAVTLSQGGEFAFAILAVAVAAGGFAQEPADIIIAVVTLSMAATPILVGAEALLGDGKDDDLDETALAQDFHGEPQVIIAGFGRFGQITARLLAGLQIPFTALEKDPSQVDFVRKFGNKIHFGDASRIDLLRSANASQAKLLVLAIDDVDASLRTARVVMENFPNLKIYARARNRQHAYELMDLGVPVIHRETFMSALKVAGEVLEGLGFSRQAAERARDRFADHDRERLLRHRHMYTDEEKMQRVAREAQRELQELFEEDATHSS